MNRRSFITTTGSASIFATIGIARPAFAATKTLRFGHWVSTDSPHHALAQHFAAAVAQKTGGAYTVSIFPSEVLGTYPQQLAMNAAGTLDFSLPTTGALAAIDKHASIVSLPYLFHSPQSVYSLLDGPVGKRLAEPFPAKGVRILAFSDNGFRNITNAKRAIEKPSDLAGLKIRIPAVDISKSLFTALGAAPQEMPFSQVYTALKAGIVDGQENPFVNIYTGKFNEVQKYLAETKHQYEGLGLVVSEKTWSSFDDKTKSAMQDAAFEARDFHRKTFGEFDSSLSAKLKASGMQFTQPSTAAFKAKSASVYDQFASVYGSDLIAEVRRSAS